MAASDSSACLPSQLWGLDPVFRSHAKLYIHDVNNLTQSDGFPGVYQYGRHPIVRVDIQGVVVRVENRARFFVYTLDDGTGVINCTCWKNEEVDQRTKQIPGLSGALAAKLAEIHDLERKSFEGHNLGDLLHVRGKLRVFRERIEVLAGYCAAVSDPNMETARMYQLPGLYRDVYDKDVELPRAIAAGTEHGQLQEIYRVYEAESAILEVTAQNSWASFSRHQLQASEAITAMALSDQLLGAALTSLTKGGHIFQTSMNNEEMFTVTALCEDLDREVLRIIKQWTDTKGGESDCPAAHILSEVCRLAPYRRLQQSALYQCLDKLEGQSDIISTAEKRFIVFCDT